MKYTDDPQPQKLPGTYKDFIVRFPKLGQMHEDIAKACESYGPLDRKTCELIKIGLSIGAGLETATRSHVRRAIATRRDGAGDRASCVARIQHLRIPADGNGVAVGARADRSRRLAMCTNRCRAIESGRLHIWTCVMTRSIRKSNLF